MRVSQRVFNRLSASGKELKRQSRARIVFDCRMVNDAASMIEKLNSLGGKWGPPVWCNEQGVDCFSQDGGEKLSIQITKISPEDYFEDLNVRGFATREQDIPSWEASDLADAIRSCESPVPI